ncbi:family 10 glycosylhydrolase [Novosphingobium flavum]|uniref:Family 10 glycosylhydrolase n=1 Tax=Novosphingobium flavum TaxID=1778672 RepID=A0A7X1FV72_9SPHN|nr:family 10 glycosylhydrolase [Novosphingobium flavum]MBC2667449.1 family 10 glycosylhydrolase [Novosphingobium flavum]
MTYSRRDALSLSGSAAVATALAASGTQSAFGAPLASAGKRWWIDESVRMALFLYNQYQAPTDSDAFVQTLVDLNANAVVLPTAGIAAFYPTKVPFHTIAPSLPAGRDLIGEIVKKAHAKGIYVVARFEWTVNQDKKVIEAHPDWVQRNAAGESPLWNDTYAMCINGGYMQSHIFKIMDEALSRYPFDGMFFNYGGGQRNAFGPCHCDNCKALFRQKYNRDIPAKPDDDYIAFMNEGAANLAAKIRAFAKAKNPNINYMVGSEADSTNSETHGAPIAEAHALWLYDASETVNRARAAFPDRMQFNNDAAFLDGRWRYAHRPAPEGEIRSYQNMANGAGPYLFVNGSHHQFDQNAQKGAAPAFKFHKDHEDLYVRQENAARVLLLDEPQSSLAAALFRYGENRTEGNPPGNGGFGYRDSTELGSGGENAKTDMAGFFRLLTEQHIPFVLSRDLSWVERNPDKYDLVISSKGAPKALDAYLRQGGRVLAAGAVLPELSLPSVVKAWRRKETLASYWRVQDKALLPSLADTDLMFFYSDYLELEPNGKSALTFVPPTKINPMEMVGENMRDTSMPGLHFADYGKGKLAYIPWNIGDLYHRASAVHHAALVGDLIDNLLPAGRQIRTNAHPTVQMTLQVQKASNRTLVHFVNLSGAAQVAYHPAIPMSGINVDVRGSYSSARMASSNRELPIRRSSGYTSFTLPTLDTYDVVVLT